MRTALSCPGRRVLDDLRRHRDHVRALGGYLTAARESKLFVAIFRELLALDELLAAHGERCRACRRRGAR